VEKPNKTASDVSSDTSDKYADVLADYPEIREAVMNFVKQKIKSDYGQVTVPHIQNEVLTQFKKDLNDEDVEAMADLISELILAAQQETPATELGSVDMGKNVGLDLTDVEGDNTDFYKPFMTTVSK
jgi:phage major head subunit gpT-like protein